MSTDPDLATRKHADVDHDVLDVIQTRWSPRAFADTPVPTDALQQVLEAARWAMSSYNEQPWCYIVASRSSDPDGYDRILSCLNEFNRSWAENAPVLMLGFVKTEFEHNGNPNRHARHDLGAASAFLTLQATKLDLYVHQMAGILPDVIEDTFDLPATVEPVTGLALGYVGDASDLPENLQERERAERSRRTLSEFVFSPDGFGHPADFLQEE